MKKNFLKSIGQNLLLLFVSLSLIYLLIELLLFRLLLPHLPLKLHGYLPEGARVLAQGSKAGAVPKNYIALVGDSYAQGAGDWYISGNHYLNLPYHSADIIHQETGKDVITFGAGGAGSLRGLVAEPISQFEYLNATLLYKLKPPGIILVYFYPGNDLKDNLKSITIRYSGEYDPNKIYDQEYFSNFIRDAVANQDILRIEAQNFNWKDNFFFRRFLSAIVSEMLAGKKKDTGEKFPRSPGKYNIIKVAGQKLYLPDRLQSPPIMLTDEEIKLSIYIFEQSLLYLADYFKNSTICVVYIPSPLECYKIISRKVKVTSFGSLPGRSSICRVKELKALSDRICSIIKEIAEKHNLCFIDTRPSLRSAGRNQLLHGPLDWDHFNRAGYTALGKALSAFFEQSA